MPRALRREGADAKLHHPLRTHRKPQARGKGGRTKGLRQKVPALARLLLAIPAAGLAMAAADAGAEAPAGVAALFSPSPACVAAFDERVQPILNLRCVQCHQGSVGDAGLSLQGAGTAERIVLAPSAGSRLNLVEPGRPEESYLYLKITGRQGEVNGLGARMPLIGGRLSDARTQTIREWIEGCTVVPRDR